MPPTAGPAPEVQFFADLGEYFPAGVAKLGVHAIDFNQRAAVGGSIIRWDAATGTLFTPEAASNGPWTSAA